MYSYNLYLTKQNYASPSLYPITRQPARRSAGSVTHLSMALFLKRAGLEMEDRIALHLESPHAELSKAIDEHCATIAGETLVIRWTDGGQHAAEVKIDAAPLTIRLEKATA